MWIFLYILVLCLCRSEDAVTMYKHMAVNQSRLTLSHTQTSTTKTSKKNMADRTGLISILVPRAVRLSDKNEPVSRASIFCASV